MRTLICQTNTTPAMFNSNTKQILAGIKYGEVENADLIVFPELSIPGYLCKDLMYKKGFVEENLSSLKIICEASREVKNTHIVVGYIDRNYEGWGKPFRNMAAVIKDGLVIATYQKQLLPFYDVFDEGRYFQPGTAKAVVQIDNKKWGICICEDIWNDKGSDDYNYSLNPLEMYRRQGIYNIISINSSPFIKDKPKNRMNMVRKSVDVGRLIYCNQIGGQDELVFDGNSFYVLNGEVVCCAGTNTYTIYDDTAKSVNGDPPSDHVYDMLKLGLRDYVHKSEFKRVVVGSSGGIDSALTIALASDVLGAENVIGVRMPTTISSDHSKADALKLHENLGCKDYLIPIDHSGFINHILASIKADPDLASGLAGENIQARLRGMVLMYISNSYNALLLSTGNKTELALGYCTLYGDMNGGFCPINDLYKMEVYDLARYFNRNVKDAIPENIINKAPSAELAPGQTDEASLLPYPILDAIVKFYVESYIADFESFKHETRGDVNYTIKEWIKSDEVKAKMAYNDMIRRINHNEFKRRQAAPGIKVSKVAFGMGRRIPIVKR